MSEADEALALVPELVEVASEKWKFFTETLKFKDDVSLQEKIMSFAFPAIEGMRSGYKELASAPDSFFMLVIAIAVVKSGTHSKDEVESALGAPLPDDI